VIAPKHVGAVLMSILILFLRQSLVNQLVTKNFGSINMRGTNVKIKNKSIELNPSKSIVRPAV
jgi:hypothetical protein